MGGMYASVDCSSLLLLPPCCWLLADFERQWASGRLYLSSVSISGCRGDLTFDPCTAVSSVAGIELVAGVDHLELGLFQQLVQESQVEVTCTCHVLFIRHEVR